MPKKSQNSPSATKNDLKNTERLLMSEVLRVEGRVEELDKKTDENQKILINKLDSLEKTLDGFVGRVDDLTIENKFGADQIHELRKQAKNHEDRIIKLESPQAA